MNMSDQYQGPIRSALFVPGNQPDRIDQAAGSGADMVIVDLEDAVPVSRKKEARLIVRGKLVQHSERKMAVRVNALESGFCLDDLKAMFLAGVKWIMLPKVETAEHIQEIHKQLMLLEREHNVAIGSTPLLILIESALGIQNIFDIMSLETDPVRQLIAAFGAADYALDLGIDITKEGDELIYPRSRLAIASRAARVDPPIDTPFMLDIKDTEAFRADASRAKSLGFQGKLCVHPIQIEPCHDIFSPALDEIAFAERVCQAYEDSQAQGLGATQLDGKMIDLPIVERCRNILKWASSIRDMKK
jgi:citrate lyase subunit beta/citryl-CoA lyase